MKRHSSQSQGYHQLHNEHESVVRGGNRHGNTFLYQRKSTLYDDDGFHPEQFRQEIPSRTPWKAIALATFLFVGGSTALIVCLLSLAGHLTLPNEGPTALLAVGLLMFVPGFYHLRIAYYAYKEYPGYSFDDLGISSDF